MQTLRFTSPRGRRTARPRLAARMVAAAAVMASAIALAVSPAAAASASADSPRKYPHPERNYMGSTIPEHERQERGRELSRQQARKAAPAASVDGIDVSHWQGNIDWNAVAADGIEFAYMKAIEGTYYTDPSFDSNYPESYYAGLVRGAYHFANPADSSGAAQARFFVNNGGGWSPDGQTLPGVLDIEYNPYGPTCYGLTDGQMINWVGDFISTYEAMTGRYPVIYTTTNWWSTCTGNYAGFWDVSPLWVANWGSDPYPLPNGAPYWTFWQYTAEGSVNGVAGNVDRDLFNGSYDRLQAIATCSHSNPC